MKRTAWFVLGVLGVLVLGTPHAMMAQTTTGSVRGYVTDSNGAAIEGAQVLARNLATAEVRQTTSDVHGFYALLGLTPGTYEVTVRRIGYGPHTGTVRVSVGQMLSANYALGQAPVTVTGITVTAASMGFETRTSEVATNVTQQQIQQLPTASGNFLNLAALAPGVTITPDLVATAVNNIPPRTFSADGQGPGNVNVFVDGASLKNDLTGGESAASGVAGQDASLGNPFPLNAIQEYRVIAQNFKAEYQRSSSAIITAVTKSGGTTWQGDAALTYMNKGMIALNPQQWAQRSGSPSTFSVPNYSRYLVDLDAGGPITADKRLRFFGSYEGDYQNRANTVDMTPITGYPALDTVNLAGYSGSFAAPFRETMLFGKLSYAVGPRQSLELSLNNRNEYDIRQFGGGGSFQNATRYRDLTTLAVLKHTYATSNGLNEATLSWSRFQRNPTPDNPGLPTRVFGVPGGAVLGSNCCSQNFIQYDLGLQDNYTYTGFHWAGDHVVKVGANLDLKTYTVDKENNSNPQFFYDSLQIRNGVDTERFNFQTPDRLVWSPVVNPFVNTRNTALGLFAQDDWSPTRRLTLNLGIRWDYESNMLNTAYVTPQDVIDTVTKYDSQLQHYIDPGTYFTDGHQRKPFLGAFQPRLGFSYALDHQAHTVLFGGWGIFYDRSYFDMAVDENLKLTNPTYTVFFAPPGATPLPGEVAWNNSYLTTNPAALTPLVTGAQGSGKEAWLIANNVKPPKSYQWNLGIRHVFGDWMASVTYAGVRGVDGLVLNWANFGLNPNGSCCTGGSPFHGFSNIIYSTNSVKTWYDALEIQINRPYRKTGKIGWGAGLSYTYATRSLQGIDNQGDEFAFPYSGGIPKHPSNDEKSRVVANWVTDVPYAWGIKFSGLITLGTGPRYDIGSRFNLGSANPYVPGGFTPPHYSFIIPRAWAFRDVDVRLEKDFPTIGADSVGVFLNVFNLFNYQNYGYNVSNSGVGTVNYGVPLTDPRYIQLGANYHF